MADYAIFAEKYLSWKLSDRAKRTQNWDNMAHNAEDH